MALEVRRQSLRRFFLLLIMLTVATFIVLIASVSVGSSMLPLEKTFSCLTRVECDYVTEAIINYRFARSAVALLVGALLATSGTLMQAIARNPLAEPYILGLSSTALTVLAAAIVINPNIIALRTLMILLAFFGALAGYILTTTLSMLAGGTGASLILSGIAVTAVFSGLSHLLLYLVQSKLKSPYPLLLMGSTSNALLQDMQLLLTVLAAGITIIYLTGLPKRLNAYVFGDTFAKQLGYDPRRLAAMTALLTSILTGSSVAIVGIVGFVGIAAPHITRLLAGTSDHRITLALSTLLGAILTGVADIAVRVLAVLTAQGEFPLGSITSIVGAPFLAYLVIKGGRR